MAKWNKTVKLTQTQFDTLNAQKYVGSHDLTESALYIVSPDSWSSVTTFSSGVILALKDKGTYVFELYRTSYSKIIFPAVYLRYNEDDSKSTSSSHVITAVGLEWIYNGSSRLIRLKLYRYGSNQWRMYLDYGTSTTNVTTWSSLSDSSYRYRYKRLNI